MKYLGDPSSGSYQSKTFSRNRFGQYMRTRATPVNPGSVPQLNVRARMSSNSAAWRALTDAQRFGWGVLGSQISRTDSLGQQYDLNGFMCYCSVNNNKLAVGDAVVSDAPALATPPDITSVTLTLTASAFDVAYTPTPLASNVRALFYVSPQQSAGRAFNGDYRLLSFSAAAAASPADLLAAYTARFGVPVAGNRIFLKVAPYIGGFRGQPFGVSQVVA